jgi:hypothetical protein
MAIIPNTNTYDGAVPKMTVTYHAKNGMTFTLDTVWYEMQETLNELSRQAYENDTEVNFVVIY